MELPPGILTSAIPEGEPNQDKCTGPVLFISVRTGAATDPLAIRHGLANIANSKYGGLAIEVDRDGRVLRHHFQPAGKGVDMKKADGIEVHVVPGHGERQVREPSVDGPGPSPFGVSFKPPSDDGYRAIIGLIKKAASKSKLKLKRATVMSCNLGCGPRAWSGWGLKTNFGASGIRVGSWIRPRP